MSMGKLEVLFNPKTIAVIGAKHMTVSGNKFAWVGLGAFALMLIGALTLRSWLVDDAAISFAYARNLARYGVLAPQPGAMPVEGFSNPLWVAIIAPFAGACELVVVLKTLAVGMMAWVCFRMASAFRKEGLIEEKNKDEESEDFSLFPSIFHELTRRFHAEFHPEMDADKPTVQFTTKNPYAPDIRSIHSTDNDHLFRINNAYRAVMGENSPMRATGGGTDAKGFLNLVTAGALFFDNMGPPVNYHGLDEGAPLVDLVNSGKILLNLLQQELPVSIAQDHSPTDGFHHSFGCCN